MKKIVVVAIRHPTESNLYLHGLRRDNHKWALVGGHVDPGETLDEAALREAREEAGIQIKQMEACRNGCFGDNDVTLFMAQAPEELSLSSEDDPDKEFVIFKWIDPLSHGGLHVPADRNILIQHLEDGNLEKMSRPRITFPKLGVLTRPDQEVQQIETKRQKDIFGRKAALDVARSYKDKQRADDLREKEAKRIAGKFSGSTLGLNVPTKYGPKSAALSGKLRSKFEEPDEGHKAKLDEHIAARNKLANEYSASLESWRKKAYELSNKISEPGGREAYEQHLAQKPPKPKFPRKPSKPLKHTKELSPEQMKLRGQSIESTIEHEGFHHVIDHIENKYGEYAANKIKNSLLSHFDKDTLSALAGYVKKVGYKPTSPSFTEEVLAWARDILVNPQKREKFKSYVGTDNYDRHIKNLKQGYQNAYKFSQELTPDAIDQMLGRQKLAANQDFKVLISIFEDLEKSAKPTVSGELHPTKPYIAKIHPNGALMWHNNDAVAAAHDRIINSPKLVNSFLSQIESPVHRKAMEAVIKMTANDPNRHYIPSEEGGKHKLRARHIKNLILGEGEFTIDTKDPSKLTITNHVRHGTVTAPTVHHFNIKIKKGEPDEVDTGYDQTGDIRPSGPVRLGGDTYPRRANLRAVLDKKRAKANGIRAGNRDRVDLRKEEDAPKLQDGIWVHNGHKFHEIEHPNTPHGFKAFNLIKPTGEADVVYAKDINEMGNYIRKISWKPKWFKSELEKSSRITYHVKPFSADENVFNPEKHDFIVEARKDGEKLGFIAITHKPKAIMPFNFEVNSAYRRKGIGTKLARAAEAVSKKPLKHSRDMTPEAKAFAEKYQSIFQPPENPNL